MAGNTSLVPRASNAGQTSGAVVGDIVVDDVRESAPHALFETNAVDLIHLGMIQGSLGTFTVSHTLAKVEIINRSDHDLILNDIDPERKVYGGYYQQYYYRRRYMTYYGEGKSD